MVRIVNETRGSMLAERARMADSFFTRLKGLLGTRSLPDGEGLVIRPCSSVHTMWMRYPIDVAFLDAEGRVLKLVPEMVAGRLAAASGAVEVVELPAGKLAETGTAVGDLLRIR